MRATQRRWWVSSGAAAISVAAHLAALAPLLLGASRSHPSPPDVLGGNASAAKSEQSVESMALVDLSSTSPSDDESALDELASAGIEIPKSHVFVVSPELAPPPVDFDDSLQDLETQAAGDTEGQAAMFGRYVGQINARIERAWMRPRDRIEHNRFSCQTKIEQDPDGRVLSVELRRCDADLKWQRSLVDAIQRASPLPSPPIPSVFTKVLTLSFSAEQYEEGVSSRSDYEPPLLRVAAQAGVHADRATNQVSPVADIPRSGAIELHIEGNEISWKVREGLPAVAQSAASPQ
jgi:hypothetical protein